MTREIQLGGDDLDHTLTDEIKCPWCGDEFMDSWEMDDDGEVECDECGKTFHYHRSITVRWNTVRKACGCHFFVLDWTKYGDHPYIYKGKNWTIYRCWYCHAKIIKTGPIREVDGQEQPYLHLLDGTESLR